MREARAEAPAQLLHHRVRGPLQSRRAEPAPRRGDAARLVPLEERVLDRVAHGPEVGMAASWLSRLRGPRSRRGARPAGPCRACAPRARAPRARRSRTRFLSARFSLGQRPQLLLLLARRARLLAASAWPARCRGRGSRAASAQRDPARRGPSGCPPAGARRARGGASGCGGGGHPIPFAARAGSPPVLSSCGKTLRPGYSASAPSASSMRSSWLYFATRSERDGRAGLDLAAAGGHGEVGDRGVLGLARAVGHHRGVARLARPCAPRRGSR